MSDRKLIIVEIVAVILLIGSIFLAYRSTVIVSKPRQVIQVETESGNDPEKVAENTVIVITTPTPTKVDSKFTVKNVMDGTFFKQIASGLGNKDANTSKTVANIQLSENFSHPETYPEIKINDIIDGTILKRELAQAKPFDENVIPLKYIRKDTGNYESQLKIDGDTWAAIKNNPSKSPFRNLYFYKIKSGDVWYTILGQQVRNSDGTTSFLHFLIHKGNEIYSWGRNNFAVEPMIIIHDAYFNEVGQRDFFSAEPEYYKRDSEINKLMTKWNETGVVPAELQSKVLMMSIVW